MEKYSNSDETVAIKELLIKHGIRQRQQMTFVADLLGLEYVSIQQKFSGKRAWTLDQLKSIAEYFKEPLATLTNEKVILRWNAILKIGDMPQRCFIQRGDELISSELENLVAVRENEAWQVIPGSKVNEGQICYRILKMEVLPQPKIAALDDVPDITDTITAMFGWHGVEVKQYQSPATMLDAATEESFDGYILDWMLSEKETAEYAIKFIREKLNSNAPISVLTGELRTTDTNQSDIARMVELYNITVYEKPAILEILVKSFSKSFFQIPSIISREKT